MSSWPRWDLMADGMQSERAVVAQKEVDVKATLEKLQNAIAILEDSVQANKDAFERHVHDVDIRFMKLENQLAVQTMEKGGQEVAAQEVKKDVSSKLDEMHYLLEELKRRGKAPKELLALGNAATPSSSRELAPPSSSRELALESAAGADVMNRRQNQLRDEMIGRLNRIQRDVDALKETPTQKQLPKQAEGTEESNLTMLSKLSTLDDRLKNVEYTQRSLANAAIVPVGKSDEPPSATQLRIMDTEKVEMQQEETAGPTTKSALDVIESEPLYVFQESVYDAMFFVFTEHVGPATSFFACLSFLLNLFLQISVIIVLLQQFIDDPLDDNMMDQLRRWRTSEGHAYQNADWPSGSSLTARVCGADPALITSTTQVQLRSEAFDYLDEGIGQRLCIVAILLWALICTNELRQSLLFIFAIFRLPESAGRTLLSVESHGIRVLSISCGRVVIGCFASLCRTTIAVFLLISGGWWLAYTTSVSDLLLRASALGFVLDIDKVIFAVLSPLPLLGLMHSVKPLRLPPYVFPVPCVMALAILLFVVLADVLLMGHTRTQLELAQDILCGERTDFVIGLNEGDWMVFAPSVPFDAAISQVAGARESVAQLLVDGNPDALKYVESVSHSNLMENLQLVERSTSMPFEDISSSVSCEDISGSKLGGRLYVVSGVKSLRSVTTCAEVQNYCRGESISSLARSVRLMCPITCGCADPMSGLWHLASHSSGCPWNTCRVVLSSLVQEGTQRYECTDTPLNELQLNRNWGFMLDQMRAFRMIDGLIFQDLSSNGCTVFATLDYEKRQTLCGTYNLMANTESALLGAGMMCPESCGCFYSYQAGPQVPRGAVAYTPGDLGLCPMRTCGERYEATRQAYYAQAALR